MFSTHFYITCSNVAGFIYGRYNRMKQQKSEILAQTLHI